MRPVFDSQQPGARYRSMVESSLVVRWVVGPILFGILIELFLVPFQPVLHDWCNKGRGMSVGSCI